jgi:hypothetical protein
VWAFNGTSAQSRDATRLAVTCVRGFLPLPAFLAFTAEEDPAFSTGEMNVECLPSESAGRSTQTATSSETASSTIRICV